LTARKSEVGVPLVPALVRVDCKQTVSANVPDSGTRKGGERMGMRRFAYGYEGPKDERSMAAAKDIAELMARKGFSYAEVDAILEQAQWILLQEYVPARPLSYAERDS